MNSNLHSREATLRRHRAVQAAERRRRRTASVIALALAGLLAIGGTVAFLVDSSNEVRNTFTPAAVKTDIRETFIGSVKSKVQIENLQESAANIPAYIRAKVVVNWATADGGNVYGVAPVLGVDYTDWTAGAVGNGWIAGGGYYYWPSPVDPGEFTGFLIEEIAVSSDVTPPSGYVLSVEILTEAVQAEGGRMVDGSFVYAVEDAWSNPRFNVEVNEGSSPSITDDTLSIQAKG